MNFPPTALTPGELALQAEVRAFLAAELPPGSFPPGLGMSGRRDPAFSRKLGERGWLGMALPRSYGGGERSLVERFVVVEELLRWGASVGFHWVADRQSAQTINRFGTAEQKERFLPAICRGELSFAIGMSEPESGSDLSSLRTTATRADGGWLITGTKVWTSGAMTCDWFILLARTSQESRPQAGLTQFLVDRRSPGLTVSPITFIDGTSDFCEVSLREVVVPDELVLGTVGQGWGQNTAELAFERGGPDRLLSTYGLFERWLASGIGVDDPVAREWIGQTMARYWAIRGLSLSIARMADSGQSPVAEAALVKELATRFEQAVTAGVTDHYGQPLSLSGGSELDRLLGRATVTGPSLTIRGGTTEILRTVAARSLGSGSFGQSDVDSLLVDTADRILAGAADDPMLAWRRAAEAGLPWLGIPESAGGSGGTLTDAVEVLYLAGRHAAPLPLAETGLLGGWLLSAVDQPIPAGPVTVVPGHSLAHAGTLTGVADGVAWASQAAAIVAVLPGPAIAVCSGGWRVSSGANLADEPRDRVVFDDCPAEVFPAPPGISLETLGQRGALTRIALIAGALAAVRDLTLTYTAQREQFGRPINRFQAVQHLLVDLAQQAALARMALDLAARALAAGDARFEIPAAALIAASAASAGAAAAHQAHGAMGMTREYPLQRFTRRLWSWRQEYLAPRPTARWLGDEIVRRGADNLYPTITGGSSEWE